jgi:hypothetical protein
VNEGELLVHLFHQFVPLGLEGEKTNSLFFYSFFPLNAEARSKLCSLGKRR